MNISSSIGPLQFAGITYVLCTIISVGVAGIIQFIIGIIKLQKSQLVAKKD